MNFYDYDLTTIRLSQVNFEEIFSRVENPIILNDVSTLLKESAEEANVLIRGNIGTDEIPCYPRCDCGNLVYGYREGEICNVCGNSVKDPFTPVFNYNVWFKAPEGVAPFINPGVWNRLSSYFSIRNSSFLTWLVKKNNKDYPVNTLKKFEDIYDDISLKLGGLRRDWNSFVGNFDNIIEALCDHPFFKKVSKEDISNILKYQRDKLFTRYLPTMHPSMYALEDGGSSTYMELNMVGMATIAKTFTGIESKDNFTIYTNQVLMNKVANATCELATIFTEQIAAASKKEGFIRQHTLATRFHFTIRAVISSKTRNVTHDRIDIAWPHAIHFFKIHLINKLLRRGFTSRQATTYIARHELEYSQLLDEIFQELLAEAGDGVAVMFIRYPSLSAMSDALKFIGSVKRNVDDHTTTMSIGTTVPYNADFDGDQMAIHLMLDNRSKRAYAGLKHSCTAVLDPIEYRQGGGILDMPAQIVPNINMAIRAELGKLPDNIKKEEIRPASIEFFNWVQDQMESMEV